MKEGDPDSAESKAEPKRAAQYIRTAQAQQSLVESQVDAIRAYAQKQGLTIVKTYTDVGKSGLSLRGRHALQKLIEDVQGGQAGYDVILLYDVSRWGRFLCADAYFECICRRAGIQVSYCAEQCRHDHGAPSRPIDRP